METTLVSVSMGVMKPLLSKLAKLLEGQYVKIKGVRKQIKFLRDELSAMSATLQMLEDAEQLNPEMRDWRDKLRELAYDLEDCVDAFMVRVDHHRHDDRSGFKQFFSNLKKLKARHEIGNQIEELKACILEASERHKRYAFVQSSHNSSTSFIDPRLPALYVDIDKLVGIDGPKKDIIERLTMDMEGSSMEVKVISIYGCGGLGKTTLANQVYHAIERQFSCAAFVSVSRTPNMTKIFRDVAKGVGFTDYTLDDAVQQLINKLRMHLHDKRYLVVIDDIWDAKAWEIIQLALRYNNSGSRIITTTRSVTVASRCSCQGGYVYQMEALSFGDSKRLFCRRAFGSDELCYPHLEQFCHGILEKCSGLPLALITVSSLLVDQVQTDEWERVLTSIGNALAKNPDAEDMTKILSLSYYDLPRELRTCFLYLCIFPEDYVIAKERLINRWIAEGFIREEQERSAYQIGEHYFNDLVNRSMIQPIDVEFGQAKACRVHDIILDYIKCKAADQNFLTSIDSAQHRCTSEYKIRRLCVINKHNEENDSIWTSLILSHVRSLSVFGHPIQISLSSLKALRVLDIEGSRILRDHHITFIEKLPHLKYLRLHSYWISNLPEKIGELDYLETLDVRGTRIKQLPSTITKLQRLAHLYVDSRVRFPDGMIGKMKSLEELAKFYVFSYEIGKSLREFSQLIKLRTLVISWNLYCSFDSRGRQQAEDLQSLVGTLISKCNLHNLYIHDWRDDFPWYQPLSTDSWCPTDHCSLQKLHITFCFIDKVQNWMSSLANLKELELQIYRIGQEDLEILGSIPSLLSLELVTFGSTNGRIIFRGNKGFRNLKYISLYIVNCGTALEFEAGSMPKVQHLTLKFCVHKMESLNHASNFGIQNLSSLAKVEVVIKGYCPSDFDDDDIVESVASAIKAAIETLPNRPSGSFITESDYNYCKYSEIYLERVNQDFGVTEWLEKCQIKDKGTEQVTAREGEEENFNISLSRVLGEINEMEVEEESC